MINDATGSKLGYIPFKSGGEAAVQLAGEHIAANVNNPSENLGQWQAGMVKPLCVFKSEKLKGRERWLAIWDGATFRPAWKRDRNRKLLDAAHSVAASRCRSGSRRLLCRGTQKVSETPEWAKYLADSSQSAAYMSGNDLSSFIKNDETAVTAVLKREGWLAN